MKGLSCVVGALFISVPLSAQTPSITPAGILNAASFTVGEPVAQGSLISIFGTNLASTLAQASTIPLSNQLLDTSVTFNGVAAPLLFVSGGQINAQVPWNTLADGVSTGNATVVVTRAGVASAPQTVAVGPFSPGIFAATTASGALIAIAVNPDGSVAAPVNAIPGLTSRPANRGDALIIYANGLGAVTPTIQSAVSPSDGLRTNNTTPLVTIGGMSAQVLFSGLAPQYVGVNQLNVLVPQAAAPGSTVPLQIQVGGITTSDKVLIAVQ